MNCAICNRGKIEPGLKIILLARDDYIDGEVTKRLYHMAEWILLFYLILY